MTSVVFIRPADDAAGSDLSDWGDEVRRAAVAAAAAAPGTVDDYAGGANTSRATIDAALGSGPDHVVWFGHGRTDALIASGSTLIDSANVGGITGVLIAIACDTALALGPTCLGGNVKAFLGFDDHVGWPAKAPDPMGEAITDALERLFSHQTDIDDAARELRYNFSVARREYEHNGQAHGLTAGEAMTAWLWAKSNGGSVREQGVTTTTLA